MESLFKKRKINFSGNHEPRVNKHVKQENGEASVAYKNKSKREGSASKIRDNLKGIALLSFIIESV